MLFGPLAGHVSLASTVFRFRKLFMMPHQNAPLFSQNLSTENFSYSQDRTFEETIKREVSEIIQRIPQEMIDIPESLRAVATYYFDGSGKAIRPYFILLVSRLVNLLHGSGARPTEPQRKIAMISEIIHTATLLHDDVIDVGDLRRGKTTARNLWGNRASVFCGNYLLGKCGYLLGSLGNVDAVKAIFGSIKDLVEGELLQLGSREKENDRFEHYLRKTYWKTASLFAESFRAAAFVSPAPPSAASVETVFQFGRNMGIAFQLMDDLLDFECSSDQLGKPTKVDLKLGLATAPVLFATKKHPSLEALILRRFSEPSDVVEAYEMVMESDGIKETRLLASKFVDAANKQLSNFPDSEAKELLRHRTLEILNRT
ncbi:unnamed protein product, partial [Cyprideis torosa]